LIILLSSRGREVTAVKRFLNLMVVVVALALCVVGVAGATVTTPPTADASDLLPILYEVGAGLLAAVLAIIAGVWLTKVPFAVINVVNRAIKRLMGKAKPAAG
jgi:protein-S-isoprenylcysteine O-methyltransferase Ste14